MRLRYVNVREEFGRNNSVKMRAVMNEKHIR